MRPHPLALYCLIGVAGVSAWSIPSVTTGRLQPLARYQQEALFVSSESGTAEDGAGAAAKIDDVSIEYNAAAKLAYEAWRQQYAPPRLKASQRVLLSAEEVAAAGGFDPEKFAVFERNYEIVTVANVRAKRAARMYGGEAEVVTLGPDADTVPLPLPPPIEPETTPSSATEDVDMTNDDGDDAAAAKDVGVSIQYNAPARLAYDEWLAANERAGEEIDDSKFKTFEQNYIAVTVANVSAKKAVRDAGESVEGDVPVMKLGPDADSVLFTDIGDITSTFSWGIFEDEQVVGSINDTIGRMGSLSFGERIGEAFKWEPSKDDKLRSALGIDDSSSSSDYPDTGRSTSFFFTAASTNEETPHPPKELPSDQDMNDHASDKYEVLSEGGEGFESKTVAELREMLKEKGMPVSGKKSELIDRLQNASDADSEVVKETQKAMEKDFGISLSTDKVREILAPIFSGKIQPNVSTDAIKGAALAGAALPILAGAKGAGLSLAALSALSSSYLAVTQGYGGDAARVVGELAWKSTSTLKSVGNATKSLLSAAVNNAKEKSREQMLEAVAKGDSVAAAKLDKDVQKVLAEAEEAVAAAERAAGKQPSLSDSLEDERRRAEKEAELEDEAIKAEELARLQDEELLAKEFERARMEEMREEAFARAEQERIEEDQRRAEEAAARLAEEDRLEEEANRLLALEEQRLAQEREAALEAEEASRQQQQQQEEELRRIAAAEEATRLAAEAEAAMLLAEREANRLKEEQASAEALASLSLDDVTKEKEEGVASEAESERLHSLQDAAEDADIAAQARAAVEAMEKQMEGLEQQMEAIGQQMEGLPDFDEGGDSFLGEDDLEAAIALAQELEDEKIAGVDDLLQALRELDVDDEFEGEDHDQVPDFDENDPANSNAPTQEQEQSPEDLAKAAREAVAIYEAEMAAKNQERKAQKSEWAEEVAAVAAASTDEQDEVGTIDASPPNTTDWASFTVVKLKDELRSRGLKVGGRKAELVQRLQEDDMSR